MKTPKEMEAAIAKGAEERLDFADALHLASSATADRFAPFDKDFVRKASKLGSVEFFRP